LGKKSLYEIKLLWLISTVFFLKPLLIFPPGRNHNHMKPKIKNLISAAVANAVEAGEFSSSSLPAIEVEEPKIETHGDFSSNISMVMAAVTTGIASSKK